MKKKFAIDLICFAAIVLFVYAGCSKLLDYEKFKVQLGQSPILTRFSGITAIGIPFIEMTISLMLITERLRLIGLYMFFSMMVMFSAYIIAITKFSEYVPCSCGGVLQKMSWNTHLVFNLFFVILAAVAVILQSGHTSFFIAIKNQGQPKT